MQDLWKSMTMLVTVGAMFFLAGCGQEAPSVTLLESPDAAAATPEVDVAAEVPLRVALVMKTLTNPFFVEMEKGARQAEADLGVELIVKTGAQETSIQQQIAIVRGLIEEEVDAIVIAPADSIELVPALAQAQKAGIAIINIDNKLDANSMAAQEMQEVPFISVDNEEGAYKSARYMSEQLTEAAEVVILEGIRTAKNADDRRRGAERAFGENPNVTVVAKETANWKIDEAYDVMARLFGQHPQIRAVFAANDMMALGVIRYLDEHGRHDVLVAGYDALDEARKAIQDGTLAATVDQQAAQQGYLGVEYAVKAISGRPVPGITLIGTQLITGEESAP